MTNSGKLFDDELTEWLLETGFIKYQCQMSIYYKYAPDGGKLLFYIMLMTLSIGIILVLIYIPPCPGGICIVGRWCSTPCKESKDTLDYVP